MFPHAVDTTMGIESWDWHALPPSKQKLCDVEQFDPYSVFFRKNAHMPQLVFLGEHNSTRRSTDAILRRAARAKSKGYGNEERQKKSWSCSSTTKAANATRGGGGDDWYARAWSESWASSTWRNCSSTTEAANATRGGGDAVWEASAWSGSWAPGAWRNYRDASAWSGHGGDESSGSCASAWSGHGGGESRGSRGSWNSWFAHAPLTK